MDDPEIALLLGGNAPAAHAAASGADTHAGGFDQQLLGERPDPALRLNLCLARRLLAAPLRSQPPPGDHTLCMNGYA